MKRLLQAVGVACLVAIAVGAWRWRGDTDEIPLPETKEGAAPAFDLPDLADPAGRVRLADYAGKPLVLNFWAAWCDPCREELPAFREVANEVGDRVAFVGIDSKDVREDALDRMDEIRSPYPSGFDPEGKVANAYRLYGMPVTVFVSPAGRILETHTGALTATGLTTRIERHFGSSD